MNNRQKKQAKLIVRFKVLVNKIINYILMKENRAIVLFVNNLKYGEVKKKIAATLGHDKAFEIYSVLLQHLKKEAEKLKNCDKILLYSNNIDINDSWSDLVFYKDLQQGKGFKNRIENTLAYCKEKGYKSVVFITADSLDITAEHISKALNSLNKHQIVIGPSQDGFVYLFGADTDFNIKLPSNFDEENNQFLDFLIYVKQHAFNYEILPSIKLIETDEDWLEYQTSQTV
jgi:glycosyltransferase A (GT-A) superfamily protein (DUF2064 family)